MAEFSIIHLSDLHIEAKTKPLSGTLIGLINDIEQRIQGMKNIILVITGDIVDRGVYGDLNDPENPVIEFFQRLKDVLGNRIVDIEICAGNHDKDMSNECLKGLAEGFQNHNCAGSAHEWSSQHPCFSKFKYLVRTIYALFDLKKGIIREKTVLGTVCKLDSEGKKYDSSYGIDFVELPCIRIHSCGNSERGINDKCKDCDEKLPELTLCFIRFNTAWTSVGKPEDHCLMIGEEQLNSLISQYQQEYVQRAGRKEQVITFCIGHHPMKCLKPSEEDKLKDALLDNEKLNADFYLCGHTHERLISDLYNNGKKLKTLVTGIGWRHSDVAGKDKHSYSIYTFDEEKNIQSSIMLRTDTHGNFEHDTSYYTTEKEKMLNRTSTPLRLIDYPFITLNAHSSRVINEFFVDDFILNQIKEFMENRIIFQTNCKKALESMLLGKLNEQINFLEEKIDTDKNWLSNTLQDDEHFRNILENTAEALITHKTDNENEFIFSAQIDLMFKNFLFKLSEKDSQLKSKEFVIYLELISKLFIAAFANNFKHDDLRIIVRGHDKNERKICQINDQGDTEIVIQEDVYRPFIQEQNVNNPDKTIVSRPYAWIDEVENERITAKAFKNHSSRIYTLNKELVEFPVEHWMDFMVITTDQFKYRYKKHAVDKGERPGLSFVFSVRLNKEKIKGMNYIEKKEKFKELSNKLYLLEYINIEKTINDAIQAFNGIYGVHVQKFLEYLDGQKKFKMPDDDKKPS